MSYSRSEAKAWAKKNWRGACNVIMPSFTSDLKTLNEARHPSRRAAQY